MANKPNNQFQKGEIVYWCHQHGHEYSVHYGIVDEQIGWDIYIDYLEVKEFRKIYSDYIKELKHGIPLDKFENSKHFYKLPQGWSYDTKLFETKTEIPDDIKSMIFSITEPKSIKDLYDNGLLIKRSEKFTGQIESEITEKGWRIVKRYRQDWGIGRQPDYVAVRCDKVYRTYDEALRETKQHIAEFERQAALSDYEWSLEEIDKTLQRWKRTYGVSDSVVEQYRTWLINRDDVEDIEIRIFGGNIQWRKWKGSKKWSNIETNL